jgi:hypothetical protein
VYCCERQFRTIYQKNQYERDTPKVNGFCAINATEVYSPFFFAESTVAGITYLDMRENRTTIQMQQDKPGALFFSKMAHPHT